MEVNDNEFKRIISSLCDVKKIYVMQSEESDDSSNTDSSFDDVNSSDADNDKTSDSSSSDDIVDFSKYLFSSATASGSIESESIDGPVISVRNVLYSLGKKEAKKFKSKIYKVLRKHGKDDICWIHKSPAMQNDVIKAIKNFLKKELGLKIVY